MNKPPSSLLRKSRAAFRRQWLCVVVTMVLGTFISLALTAIFGVPAPRMPDEFAYILGSETFASGQLTNPTHPMWQHFETLHIIQQPSYAPKYPPAQSLMLAVGQLLGHPVIGSSLGLGLSMAALAWMLLGWLPKKYNALIVLFVACHPAFQYVWGQSYWGGALAMAGSSLLVGSFARLRHDFQIKYAVIAGFGVVLLANCRPFEGAVLTAAVGVALLFKLVKTPQWETGPFLVRVIAPGLVVLGLGAAWMMTYNQAVSGSPFKMPYKIHEETYGWTPLFLWQTAGEKPVYRHSDIEAAHVRDKEVTGAAFSSLSQILTIKCAATVRVLWFFCGGSVLVMLLSFPRLMKLRKYSIAFAIAIPAFFAGMATPWEWPHYCAAATPLAILFLLASWIEFWQRSRSSPQFRTVLIIAVFASQIYWTYSVVKKHNSRDTVAYANQRADFVDQLKESPGQDLVVIRYTDVPSHQWVYNGANIDDSEIVWGREISDDAREKLIEYFSDRKVWLLDTSSKPVKLQPYQQ